jgi:Arc/MetJ-type ribon-helix-helix transcriptional regulator
MVDGMASKKITVTLAAEQIAKVKQLVEAGQAASVSGFVQHAVAVSLQDVAGWGAMLAKALKESGGPLTSRERAWADDVMGPRRARSTKKRRAA